ncbi:MAG: T9SS type A sorting domain-containing protein, partial [Saprospiraceae bacterium]
RITNLAGLAQIESIRGNLKIEGNRGLKNLDDLVALDSIYGLLDVLYNDSLYSMSGVNGLRFIRDRIYIVSNPLLEDLGEFNHIDSIPELYLDIPAIREFNALPNLRKVNYFHIRKSILKDLSGFSSLEQINNLEIRNGDSLVSLHGLENITVLNSLHIQDNPLLMNLAGLGALDTLFNSLSIVNNLSLNSLDVLENTFSSTLRFIRITDNPNLFHCHYNFICDALAKVDVTYRIENNATGCRTFFDVARNCQLECPGNVNFKTQNEVDSFSVIFPNCTFIPGGIELWYADVTNFDSLYHLTGIGDYLHIGVSSIKSIYGLRNLNTIGQYLNIEYCDSLNNLTGLEGITKINYLRLDNNSGMRDMSGLSNLTEAETISLDDLPAIDGFNNLKTVRGGFYVSGWRDNVDLLEFTFPPKLDSIYYEFSISDIDSLKVFPNAPALKYIGNLSIVRTNLKSLEGLSDLEIIDGDLNIIDNPMLKSLDGIRNVGVLNGRLVLDRNEALTNIEALSNINPDSMVTNGDLPVISITHNTALSNCAIEPVCNILSVNDSLVLIEGNDAGCFNEEEVLYACLVNAFDPTEESLIVYPNPSRGEINIRDEDKSKTKIDHVIIYNQTGSLVEIANFESPLNLAHLADGLYSLVFVSEDYKLFSCRIVIIR